MAKEYIYELMIREKHLDTLGHVNNATYLEIFEEARWDILESGNIGLESIKDKQIGPVILEINLQFKKELLNRHKIKIKSWCETLKKDKTYTIHQIMYNDKDEEACVAKMVFCIVDLKLRKSVQTPKEWATALGLD